jgi:hypothetical protein
MEIRFNGSRDSQSEDAIAQYQKEALTGHRPTWKMGSIGGCFDEYDAGGGLR